MGDKLLTIGIGVYKRDKSYIRHTLTSIINNLAKNLCLDCVKILVVNDCEYQVEDFLIAKQFESSYPNLFQLYDNKSNKGIAFTYSKMVQLCDTDFFMPFDSDDIFGDFNIKEECQFLTKNDNYCGSYGKRRLCDFQNKILLNCIVGGQYKLQDFIDFNCSVVHNAMILRTIDAQYTGNYLPKYLDGNCVKVACDFSMFVAMMLYKDLCFRNQIRCYYNEHEKCFHKQQMMLFPQQFKKISRGIITYCEKQQFNCLNMHPLYYSAKKFLQNESFYIKNSWLGRLYE